jgi:protein-tyrosine phosphatase
MSRAEPIRICFVCLGNICRSPTAEGVMQQLTRAAGIADRFVIDSAGTGAYHVGERADSRSRAEALRRGVDLTSRARVFVAEDFERFDYLIAMDRKNFSDMQRLARDPALLRKLHLLRSFDNEAAGALDVPDPYHDAADGFARVYDICEAGCLGLLQHLRTTYDLVGGQEGDDRIDR